MWLNQDKLLMQTTDRIDDKDKGKELDHLWSRGGISADIRTRTWRGA
jgi:hypothetical protein